MHLLTHAAINNCCYTPRHRFTELLTGCLRNAIEQGFETIMVTPHMDNSVSNYYWRNYLRMDPALPVNGFSYWDIQLGPLATAINANLRPGVTFLFNLQGEMGTSLFGWPMQYLLLMQRARVQATAGKPQLASRVQMGFKLVVDTVYGVDNKVPVGELAEQSKQLFYAADFVAISAYAALPTRLQPRHLQKSAEMVHRSLMMLGLDLTTKPVFYGEYGVGGGTSQYCNKLARNAADVSGCWRGAVVCVVGRKLHMCFTGCITLRCVLHITSSQLVQEPHTCVVRMLASLLSCLAAKNT